MVHAWLFIYVVGILFVHILRVQLVNLLHVNVAFETLRNIEGPKRTLLHIVVCFLVSVFPFLALPRRSDSLEDRYINFNLGVSSFVAVA